MRVAFLAAANSVHTVRWVNGLAGRGLEVHLISAQERDSGVEPRVHWRRLKWSAPWAYGLCAGELAAHLRSIEPDILNAHYASGYGLLARLAGFKPTLLSVWGSDVYDFPRQSPVHRWLVRGNLRSAAAVASTSQCMARKVAELHDRSRLFVTPFGVDECLFAPGEERPQGPIVIGTVKTLAKKYGIDVLIDAFALLVQRLGATTPLRLEITGGGNEAQNLQRLVQRLSIAHLVTFHGAVPHALVPGMLRRLDIFAALSRDDSESFGVAAVEAAACGKPVVVSDVDGLAEVTRHEETGLIVPRENPRAAADALLRLTADAALRSSYGRAGRAHVLRNYTWNRSLDLMIEAYRTVTAAGAPAQ